MASPSPDQRFPAFARRPRRECFRKQLRPVAPAQCPFPRLRPRLPHGPPSRSACTRIGEEVRRALRRIGEQGCSAPAQCAPRSAITRGRSGGRPIATEWPSASRQERRARRLEQCGHLRRLRRNRQRARVDAPGIQQVGNQTDHPVGLLVDDAEEGTGLRRCEVAHPAEHSSGRALDGSERGFAARGSPCRGTPSAYGRALRAAPGPAASPPQNPPHHLGKGIGVALIKVATLLPSGVDSTISLGAHRLAAAESFGDRVFGERDLTPRRHGAG